MFVKRSLPDFPRLNQREMAGFLGIKPSRLEKAGTEKIVERDEDGSYRPEIVTLQWLDYERAQNAKGKKRSELERQRARLTRAKAEAAELRLARERGKLIDLDANLEILRAVCLRIRSKFQAAVPRLAHGCYSACSPKESLNVARHEFDVVLSEFSSLTADDLVLEPSFEVVQDGETGSQADEA